jgi:hypothetical protein
MKKITKTLARLLIIIYNLILKFRKPINNKETKLKIKTERNRFGYPFYK